MHIEKPTPWNLIIKSSTILVWILYGATGFAVIYLLVILWIEANFVVGQEVIGLSLPLLLIIFYSLSKFRLPIMKVSFDKHDGYFTLEKKWLWTHQIVQHPMGEIKDIHVIQKGRFGKARLYYKIRVELFSGVRVPISAMNYRPEEHVRTIAKELKEFLETANLSDLAAKQKQGDENY
jgi:hypothetical protein